MNNFNLGPNIKFLSTQQHAYQYILLTSWYESLCVTVIRWVNFRNKHLDQHELQLSDHNV